MLCHIIFHINPSKFHHFHDSISKLILINLDFQMSHLFPSTQSHYFMDIRSRETDIPSESAMSLSAFNAFETSTPRQANFPPGLFSPYEMPGVPAFQASQGISQSVHPIPGSQNQQGFRQTQTFQPSQSASVWSGSPQAHQQHFYPRFSIRPSSSSTQASSRESFFNSSGSGLIENGLANQSIREEMFHSDENVALELQRRELEVQVLKSEIKRLSEQVQKRYIPEAGVYKVDLAVKLAFDEKAKCLRERDAEIVHLTQQLELVLTSITKGSSEKKVLNMARIDPEVLANRVVTRITALREENAKLGVRF